VVLERDAYGAGRHRFHPGFLDYAGHAGFLPRLCRPYRACTKGKVERFIRYLKGSFWVPFAAGMKQAGVVPDHHAANAAVFRWLREVANARIHGTTGEVPAARLLVERQELQQLPPRLTGVDRRARCERGGLRRRRSPISIRYRSMKAFMPEARYERASAPADRGTVPGAPSRRAAWAVRPDCASGGEEEGCLLCRSWRRHFAPNASPAGHARARC
jgi:hypothetical protein